MCFLEISYKLVSQVDKSHMWSWHEENKVVLRLDLILLTHEMTEILYVQAFYGRVRFNWPLVIVQHYIFEHS
jgi:hypothetical protein